MASSRPPRPEPSDLATLPGDGGVRLVRARRRALLEGGAPEAAAVADALLADVPGQAFALALRALSSAHAWTTELDEADARARADRATAAVAEAITLASQLPDTHCADAQVALAGGHVDYAVRAVRRALARDPMHAAAHELLGTLELETGMGSDARLRLADALEPGRATPLLARASAACFGGHDDEALRLVDEAEARGTHPRATLLWRARRCVWVDDRHEARRLLGDQRLAASAQPITRFTLEAFVDGASPDAIIPFFVPLLAGDMTPAQKALLFHLQIELFARTHPEVATLHLVRAATLPTVDLKWLDGCPALASLRTSPGFLSARAMVVERVRLAFGSRPAAVAGAPSDEHATVRLEHIHHADGRERGLDDTERMKPHELPGSNGRSDGSD